MKIISLIPLLTVVQAGELALSSTPPKSVTCGDQGTSQTNIAAGNEDYFTTISIPKAKGPTFQIHANVTIKTGFSCSPDVNLMVVGVSFSFFLLYYLVTSFFFFCSLVISIKF